MVNEGDKAPDVTLNLADGSAKQLSDYQGHPLVLYFYPKDDTPGCTNEAKDFTALSGDFGDAAVVGVSKDTVKKHNSFIAKHGLTVMLASDSDDSVCDAFGTWIEKSMYGRKYMGIERATFLIDNAGKVARVWRPVKVPGHATDVLAAVKALG